MNDIRSELPAWNDGQVLEHIVEFLRASTDVAPAERIAVFDNDGTLWCERPNYVQHYFLAHFIAERTREDPTFDIGRATRDLMDGNPEALHTYPLNELAAGINKVFVGLTPQEFAELGRDFVLNHHNPALDRPFIDLRYRPMLELLAALKQRDFRIFLVTGGGTEFVRSISRQAYGIPPERVAGTQIAYEVADRNNRVELLRTDRLTSQPNEGEQKIHEIQECVGERPLLAAGNSAGDLEMLDYAAGSSGPSLALLVDHDDPDREFSYKSVAATFADNKDIVAIARDKPWQVVSIQGDWNEVF